MARKDANGRNLKTGEYYDSKNNRYQFRKMIDGKRITITSDKLADLRKQENELLCRLDKGVVFDNKRAKMTLNEYFDYWFGTYARSGRKATTCTNYKSYYNTYIRETIGKKAIVKITKLDCQRIINEMVENGKKHSTMLNLKCCLNKVFESAIDEDILMKNPIKNLQVPNTERKKRTAIEYSQIEIFMNYVRNSEKYSKQYSEFVVLFNTGMRIGELAALTWDCIDFENNTIRIDKTVNRYRKKDFGFTVAIASPKSKTSTRVIPMSNDVRKILLKHKLLNIQPVEPVPVVDDYGNIKRKISNLVFVNSQRRVWIEPNFLALINRIIKNYNKEADREHKERIENFCPHMARHTYTTLAYSAGADVKAVSEILGHASTSVTIDTYAHLTEEKKRKQEEVIKTIKVL